MGLFSKLRKKEQPIEFIVPIKGELIEITEIPDPVFSGKMMGDGFGIKPANGEIYAPVSGVVSSIFPTLHAIGISVNDDVEILIHFGLDTVNLRGEGFEAFVAQGDKITAGDLMLKVDVDAIVDKVPSITTPIIFTKLENKEFSVDYGNAEAKQAGVITIKPKE